jgi:hypothetical protein
MKAPNTELFRLVRFAIQYRGWHSYAPDMRSHLLRAERLGLLEVSKDTKQFRLRCAANTYNTNDDMVTEGPIVTNKFSEKEEEAS